MEIMNPIAIIICFILVIVLFFVKLNKNDKYTNGKKVANTKYIKETEYYKEKMKKYKLLSNLVKGLTALCILITAILISRPVTIENKSEDKYNRDIIIGLDVSLSEAEVNLELVKKFKTIVSEIEGDRIGIVIFNTAPIVFCPLTDDYEYINECLEKIEKYMRIELETGGNLMGTEYENDNEIFSFWYGGVVANSDVRGSSLVGDGLARYTILIPRFKNK